VERDFGWMSRFGDWRETRSDWPTCLKGFHLIAFTMLMWRQVFRLCVL
jgi:hypothetical protein